MKNSVTDSDALVFAEEPLAKGIEKPGWHVLIVDDEEGVHTMTELVLSTFTFDDMSLIFHHAYSGAEAKRVLTQLNDTLAIVLLDVVMETPESGLEVVRYLRGDLQNKTARIILRTGQPGAAPEETIITNYDINDYKEKSELTRQKLFTSLTTALRSYRDIMSILKSREELHKIIHASTTIFKLQSLREFCQAVLQQLSYLLHIESPAIYVQADGFAATARNEEFVILAATGQYAQLLDKPIVEALPEDLFDEIQETLKQRKSQYRQRWYIGYFETDTGVKNLICIESHHPIDAMTLDLIQIFNVDVGIAFNNLYLNKEVVDTQKELIFRLGEIVENRSQETSFHVRRVADFTQALALRAGYTRDEADALRLAAAMHDIGKLGIPDSILIKPEPLTPEEYAVMKTHTTIGHTLLSSSERPIFHLAADVAWCHHERWDGNGYPRGLKGDQIPFSARLTSICDVFDALSTPRVYRSAWGSEQVLEYIRNESGKAFDPVLVELFFSVYPQLEEIRKAFSPGLR